MGGEGCLGAVLVGGAGGLDNVAGGLPRGESGTMVWLRYELACRLLCCRAVHPVGLSIKNGQV